MYQRLFLFIIFLKFLLINSQQFSYSHGKVNLDFHYSPGKSSETTRIPVTTHPVLRIDVNNSYILIGTAINDKTFVIRAFNCINFRCNCEHCGMKFENSYILLQTTKLTEQYVLIIEKNTRFKELLRNLSSRISFDENDFNLTCVIVYVDPNFNHPDKPHDLEGYSLSKTSIFGIIFLSVCIVLVFVISIGWCTCIYYRRFKQYRMKKKLRKALQQLTQQMLAKSPVIIFDPDDKENTYTDNDPVCAICLESFKSKEKIRKLICSHYFHIICIDPWLLSHQSCPLCNRNILRNSIPSISSSIMAAINERNNEESISIANNDTYQTAQPRNFNL